jgi:D-amino peptidase
MNKYLLSVDIEGITGVIDKNFSNENGKYYPLACRYMASDVNAVIQGILKADSDAEIVVRDAHGTHATNLDLEKLHPKARLIQGWDTVQNMLTGLEPDFAGVFFVGFHAGGQNTEAVLSHTLNSIIQHVKINGKLVNETGIFALYAGYYNIPVAFISGDDHTINEAQKQLGEDIVGVTVKQSYSRGCAASLSLEQARELLEKGAAEAIIKIQKNQLKIFNTSSPISLEIKFYDSGIKISILQNLFEILAFDSTYKFNCSEHTMIFSSRDILEMSQRLNMIMFLVYGIRSSG